MFYLTSLGFYFNRAARINRERLIKNDARTDGSVIQLIISRQLRTRFKSIIQFHNTFFLSLSRAAVACLIRDAKTKRRKGRSRKAKGTGAKNKIVLAGVTCLFNFQRFAPFVLLVVSFTSYDIRFPNELCQN